MLEREFDTIDDEKNDGQAAYCFAITFQSSLSSFDVT